MASGQQDRELRDRVVSLLRDAVDESDAGHIDLLDFLDGLPDCIGWTGRDMRYRFVNRAYAAWFGVPRHQVIGKTIEEMCGADTFAMLLPYIERALAGERVRFPAHLSLRGAPARDIVVTLVARFDEQGRTDGYLAHVEDVSERDSG